MEFKIKFPIQVRFSDFDSLGHVNNANILTYFEEARIQYFDHVITKDKTDWSEKGVILARAAIDFRKPLNGYDHYFIYIRCSRLGNKSFDFHYNIFYEKDTVSELMAEGSTTMVCFDYAAGKSVSIPAEWRNKVQAFESLP